MESGEIPKQDNYRWAPVGWLVGLLSKFSRSISSSRFIPTYQQMGDRIAQANRGNKFANKIAEKYGRKLDT